MTVKKKPRKPPTAQQTFDPRQPLLDSGLSLDNKSPIHAPQPNRHARKPKH